MVAERCVHCFKAMTKVKMNVGQNSHHEATTIPPFKHAAGQYDDVCQYRYGTTLSFKGLSYKLTCYLIRQDHRLIIHWTTMESTLYKSAYHCNTDEFNSMLDNILS